MSFFDYPTAGDEDVGRQERYFLPDCSQQDWSLLLEYTSRRHFHAGDTVIEPTQSERALYIVIDGMLEVLSAKKRRGRRRRLAALGPGTVIGELSFFDGHPRSAVVVGVTDGELARLSLEDLEALAGRRPELGRAVLFDLGRLIAGRLRDVQSQVDASEA